MENINLMSLYTSDKVEDMEVKPTRRTLQFVDQSVKYPYVFENILLRCFFFPANFVVMDMTKNSEVPIISGELFMKISQTIIDARKRRFKLKVQDEVITFNVIDTTYNGVYFLLDALAMMEENV